MRSYASILLALAASAVAAPQGVTGAIAPSSPVPAGCQGSYSGVFEITVVNVTSAAKAKRAALELTLSGNVLKDSEGRTGYIASNFQFQFDDPPQAGAIYTSGFSVCANGTLALGGSAVWYQCYSGGFYNLYDTNWAAQCSPIYIEVIGAAPQAATQATDGQPVVTTQVSQISDGQVQATTLVVSQITDGQIQNGGGVTQISDGQIQAPTAAAVGQISDGQIQATTAGAVAVTQISDGQIQAATATPVGEQTDGQPTVGSAIPHPVTQISDGQVQAGTTAPPVTQISDGQVQAGATVTSSSPPLQQTTNAAPVLAAEVPAVVAGLFAAIAFL